MTQAIEKASVEELKAAYQEALASGIQPQRKMLMTQAIEKAKHTPGPWEVGPVDDTDVPQFDAARSFLAKHGGKDV